MFFPLPHRPYRAHIISYTFGTRLHALDRLLTCVGTHKKDQAKETKTLVHLCRQKPRCSKVVYAIDGRATMRSSRIGAHQRVAIVIHESRRQQTPAQKTIILRMFILIVLN